MLLGGWVSIMGLVVVINQILFYNNNGNKVRETQRKRVLSCDEAE